MTRWHFILAVACFDGMATLCAVAQNAPVSAVPVDQAVGDLDPLSQSLRRIDVGLGRQGQQSGLFLLTPGVGTPWLGVYSSPVGRPVVHLDLIFPPAMPHYVRVAAGVRVYVDRMDYVVQDSDHNPKLNAAPLTDGQFRELAPPNMLFDLTVRPPVMAAPVAGMGAETTGNANAAWAPGAALLAVPALTGTQDAAASGRIDTRIDSRIDARVRDR